MIRELSIRNLAIIDSLSLEFFKGFSVFTGETGAGKSILIEAIGLILGERASSELVRSGNDECEITGVFEVNPQQKLLGTLLHDADIRCEDNTLIIRRIIARNGRNRVHINQTPTPLSTLKAIGDHLVDLHGQHEHQALLKPETANHLINQLPTVKPLWDSYQETFTTYTHIKEELAQFDRKVAQDKQMRDLIAFQYQELKEMALSPDEESALEEEYTLLSSHTDRMESIASIAAAIDGSNQTDSLDRQIATIKKNLESLAKFDTTANPWLEDVENAQNMLSELSAFCSSYLTDSENQANPQRLEQINSRLAKIQRLKKKYHCTFTELCTKETSLKNQLDSIENSESDRTELLKRVTNHENQCLDIARKLNEARSKATLEFDRAITKQMTRLGFTGGSWQTTFVPEEKLMANGLETILFEVRTNVGEPFLPLAKTASGGEISRLMLAIKTVLASQDTIPILIFDEIDSGIGGHLAKEVAASLYALRQSHQVLCISHLHQIASLADSHYHVYKKAEKNRTVTQVAILNEEQQIEEISRMLGSDSTVSKDHARELVLRKKELFKS